MTTRARCVRIEGRGGVEVLGFGDLEIQAPGPGQVLVEIAAAGLNRADVLQRKGLYPAPAGVPGDVPGLEYAGTVARLGAGVTDFEVGDRVMGIVAGGAMATHVVVHAREAIPVPEGLSLPEAAAVPEVFLTAYDALFLQAGLRMGEVVLVHAVGSGVGTAAVQLALAAGARPVGTSRTREKLRRVGELGGVGAILVENGRFADELSRMTAGQGADIVLDTVGAAYLKENVKALAPQGRIVLIGLMGGASGEMPLGLLLPKRGRIHGTVLRSRPLEEKAVLAQAFAREVLPLLGSGKVRPVVDEVMPMDRVAEAHERMESNATFGKIVLAW